MRKADKACAKYREAIKAPEMSDEEKEKFRKGALEHARCMRDHGIDMPDPRFDEDGGAQVRIGRGTGVDPEQPEVPGGAEGLRGQDARTSDDDDEAMKRLAGGAVAAAGLVAAGVFVSAATRHRARRAATPSRATAAVERRDLVDRENLAGTLGYADAGTLAAGVSGTLTALREPGAIDHPRPLALRGRRQAGRVPAVRRAAGVARLPSWMTDGEDIRQLERNLRALGHDPGTVDDDWDCGHDRGGQGLPGDAGAHRGRHTDAAARSCSAPGAIRIGEAKATVGDSASPAGRSPRSPRTSGA